MALRVPVTDRDGDDMLFLEDGTVIEVGTFGDGSYAVKLTASSGSLFAAELDEYFRTWEHLAFWYRGKVIRLILAQRVVDLQKGLHHFEGTGKLFCPASSLGNYRIHKWHNELPATHSSVTSQRTK